jgi:hypothetical protein
MVVVKWLFVAEAVIAIMVVVKWLTCLLLKLL